MWRQNTHNGSSEWLPSVVSRVPSIVYQELPGAGWSEMGEVRLD